MSRLKYLLSEDLSRQYLLEGRNQAAPGVWGIARRLLHPRFLPIVLCRTSRALKESSIPILPGVLTYLNFILFGIEITPQCEIGPGIFFPHTFGTVIGANRLGSNVTVFQGVTLGAKDLDMSFNPATRPCVGDSVTLGSGSKILGAISIGDNVTVGA